MRILYFGTYERDYPRNAQVIAALRGAGVEVSERHVSVWERDTHKWRAGARTAARLALAEAEKAGVPMPSVGVVRDRLITGIARGYGELDWTALGLIAAEEAGLAAEPAVPSK